MHSHRTILISAILGAVAFWPAASLASAVPGSQGTPAALVSGSPYQDGYAAGYAAGDSHSWNRCDCFIPPGPPGAGEGAYWSGYTDGWFAGIDAGCKKYCHT